MDSLLPPYLFGQVINSNRRVALLVLNITMFTAIPVLNANSAHSAVYDLVLYCLPVSLLWDDRHKWVKSAF